MKKVNAFLIGNQSIASEEHRKRVLLAGYFLLIYLCSGCIWMVLGFLEKSDNTVLYIGFLSNLLSLWLIRKGYFQVGTLLLFLRGYGVTTYYSWLFPNTNSDLFYMFTGLAAMAIFGYEKRIEGLLYAGLSFILYLIVSTDFKQLVIGTDHTAQQVSFVLTYIALCIMVYFFNSLTYQYTQRIEQQNIQLIKANQELDQFVYTASHDLKAPLNSIAGIVTILKTTTSPEETQLFLGAMEKSVASLRRFIDDLTHYTRNTRTAINHEEIDLHGLINEIYSNLVFDEKGKKVLFKNKVDTNLVVISDLYRIRLILNNFLSNGIKYSDDKKAEPYLEVNVSEAPDSLLLTISDNGIGIEADRLPQLFQMFYRATSREKGAGLGLYIAKESIGKLGGRIEVDSTFGMGTTFSITLPMRYKKLYSDTNTTSILN